MATTTQTTPQQKSSSGIGNDTVSLENDDISVLFRKSVYIRNSVRSSQYSRYATISFEEVGDTLKNMVVYVYGMPFLTPVDVDSLELFETMVNSTGKSTIVCIPSMDKRDDTLCLFVDNAHRCTDCYGNRHDAAESTTRIMSNILLSCVETCKKNGRKYRRVHTNVWLGKLWRREIVVHDDVSRRLETLGFNALAIQDGGFCKEFNICKSLRYSVSLAIVAFPPHTMEYTNPDIDEDEDAPNIPVYKPVRLHLQLSTPVHNAVYTALTLIEKFVSTGESIMENSTHTGRLVLTIKEPAEARCTDLVDYVNAVFLAFCKALDICEGEYENIPHGGRCDHCWTATRSFKLDDNDVKSYLKRQATKITLISLPDCGPLIR